MDEQKDKKEAEVIKTPDILVSKYRYHKLLGEGANGKTWLARNILTGELVAIKSLKLSQSENFKSFELFQREAEVLESVHVQGVPTFYESIVSDEAGGECYIIQEYVQVPALQQYLNDHMVFRQEEVLMIMRNVAIILNALHTAYVPPIIHRDIKPSNIMCALDDDGKLLSQLYLIDFGAVANPQAKSGGSTIAGTYGYMAPEQMLGECTPVSDLYALGMTAIHLLTRVPPYEIESDGFKIHFEEVLKEHAPETTQGMKMLLSELVDPNPQSRTPSASELIRRIDYVLSGLAPDGSEIESLEALEWYQYPLYPFKKVFRAFSRLKKRLDDKVTAYNIKKMESSFVPDPSWPETEATIYACNYRLTRCVEYYFTVRGYDSGKKKTEDRLFIGLTPFDDIPELARTDDCDKYVKVPAKGTVQYNPEFPRFSIMRRIDEKYIEVNKEKKTIKEVSLNQLRTNRTSR